MPIKNLASGTLAESVSASATTLLVYVGNGSASTIKAVWPTTPFYVTIMPSAPSAGVPTSLDSEVVRVTAVGNDQVGNTALTVVRGQRGSTAQAFAEGAIVTNANYAEDAVLLGDDGTAETPSPWINATDIIWSTMVDKIYPVGSIYMSATLSTPEAVSSALGGTWVAWGSGRVPVGVNANDTSFDTVEETGGYKNNDFSGLLHYGMTAYGYANGAAGYSDRIVVGITNGRIGTDESTYAPFSSMNNLQPYITCYMYKRTA